jgi:hypothetical protein
MRIASAFLLTIATLTACSTTPGPVIDIVEIREPVRVGRVILVPDGFAGRFEPGGGLVLYDEDPGPGDRPYDVHLDCSCLSATDPQAGSDIVIGVDGTFEVDEPQHAGESGGCDWSKDESGNWNCKKEGDTCRQPTCSISMHEPH